MAISSKPQIHVIIVGAGLGGLTAAIALRRANHFVTVLEQAPKLGEIGAGIQIPPNSSRIFERWGLKEKFEKKSIHPNSFILRSYKDGQVLSKQPLVPYVTEEYGYPYWHIHRADFHEILVEEAQRLGTKMELGVRVDNIDFNAPSCSTADGRTFTADLIVAADGLKSVCRELFLGKSDPPHLTGDLAYRVLIPREEMKKDPEVEALAETPQINYWMGPDSHFVLYLLKGGELFNAVILCPDNLPEGVNVQKADLDELKTFFKNWDPRLRRLLNLVTETSKWRLQNSREMDSWVHENGNFALLGDACHSTLPYLAQGAAQACEDGAVLGGLLSRIESRDQIHDILRVYENLRKKRTTSIVQGSTALRDIFHLHDGPKQEERNRILLEDKPVEGFPNRWRDPVFQKFMFGIDFDKEIERGWNHYKSTGKTNVEPYSVKHAVLKSQL